MNESLPVCLMCERNSDDVPLIPIEYRGATIRVCPQHLPILIHDPGQLIGRLSGAERFLPSEHHD
jgi:hypothetical protein